MREKLGFSIPAFQYLDLMSGKFVKHRSSSDGGGMTTQEGLRGER